MKNISNSNEGLMKEMKITNQVIKSRIIDFNITPKTFMLNIEVCIDFINSPIDEMKLAIVERASEKKIFFDGLIKKKTNEMCTIEWKISSWKEICSILSISSEETYVFDFYIVYSSNFEAIDMEYSRLSLDFESEKCDQLFFYEDESATLILRPYITIKGKFSVEIDFFSQLHHVEKKFKLKVSKRMQKIAKRYFLNYKDRSEEHSNTIIIKPPKEIAFEAKMVSQILSLQSSNKDLNYVYVCTNLMSKESRKLLLDELQDRIIFFNTVSEECIRYLTTAKFEYSLEDELQFNSVRDSNVFIKNVTLKNFNTSSETFQIEIALKLHDNKQIESIQLELKECDSKMTHLLDPKSLNIDNGRAVFEFKLADFTRLLDNEHWIKLGSVDVSLYVKLQEMAPPTYGVAIIKEKATKLDSDFSVEESDTESFVISPYFEKNTGFAFGTALIETKIFKKYVLDADLRLPVMNSQKRRLSSYYASNYDNTKLDEYAILYETRNGRSITCSPYAIFKYLISNPEYSQFKHYWVVKKELLDEIKENTPFEMLEKMTLVVKESKAYYDLFLTAKYIIVNGSCLKPPFRKKEGQVSINTWHGVPIKHMGFDTPRSGIPRFKNVIRQFMALDYLISPNPHTTQVMVGAYKLNDLFEGEILEYGYPRMDITVNNQIDIDKQAILGKNIQLDLAKPILVYMPTWRGGTSKQAIDGVEILVQEVLGLKERIGSLYNILVKVHPFLFEYVKDDVRLKDSLVSDFSDPNEVLSAVDVMIADYSSVFFDFIPTRKPIVYYMKDRAEYEGSRGLYLSPDNLPGTVVYHLDELAKALVNLLSTDLIDQSQTRDEFIAKYSVLDDGEATKRVVEHIFKGKKSDVGKAITLKSNKKKVLIKLETLASNEITEKYIKLTHNINFNKYDITHLCKLDEKGRENVTNVHSSVRQMFDSGTKIYSMEERILARYYKKNKDISDVRLLKAYRLFKAYQREESRLVPINAFNCVIDFEENPDIDIEKLISKNKLTIKNLFKKFYRKQKKVNN